MVDGGWAHTSAAVICFLNPWSVSGLRIQTSILEGLRRSVYLGKEMGYIVSMIQGAIS